MNTQTEDELYYLRLGVMWVQMKWSRAFRVVIWPWVCLLPRVWV